MTLLQRDVARRGLAAACALFAAGSAACRSDPPPAAAHAAVETSPAPRAWPDPEAAPRPDIVLVVADDLGLHLAAYERALVATPALDAIAREGVVFTRAHAASAICSPSRATIYTGLAPHQTGVLGLASDFHLDDGVVLVTERLRRVGYATGAAGKIHLLPRERFVWDHGYVPLERGAPDRNRDAVAALVARAARDRRPFFLAINPLDPHRSAEEGDDTGATAPAGEAIPLEPYHLDIPAARRVFWRYRDGIARLDAFIADLVAALAGTGRLDTTLLVVTSDHGEPQDGAKATLYEPGLRVPLLVRWPDRVAGSRRDDGLVGLVDLVPTFLDVAGAPGDERLEGLSLAPRLVSSSVPTAGDRWLVASHTYQRGLAYYPSRALIGRRFKYVRNLRPDVEFRPRFFSAGLFVRPEVDERTLALAARLVVRPAEEYYDLEADPWEMNDLARDPRYAAAVADARTRLKARLERQGDPLLELWDRRAGQPDPFEPRRTVRGQFAARWLPDAARRRIEAIRAGPSARR